MDNMNEKYSAEDEAVMVQALTLKSIDQVWNEYVETCQTVMERIYWRGLFFDTMSWFSPILLETMPRGKEFVYMIEQWMKECAI